MGPPFVLGIGNSGLYQDGKFVLAFVDRCSKAQVVQMVKAPARHFWTSKQCVVGTPQGRAGNFKNVVCQWFNRVGQGVVGDLGESFGHF